MQRIIIVSILSLFVILLIACQSEQKAETKMEEQVSTTVETDTTMVICAACSMSHASAEMISHEIDGKTHHFCSEYCQEQYMAALEESSEEKPADE